MIRHFLARTALRLGRRPRFIRMRERGYALLSGQGVEIGAFEHPAPLPAGCTVRYLDVLTPAEAARLFPEIDAAALVQPDIVVDIDAEGLAPLADASLDFVIACHVIEHLANPGRFVAELARVVRPGGHMVIAAPDKQHTFDRRRAETPLATLERYHREGRPPVTPEDYREMVAAVHPELMRGDAARVQAALESFHRRREHLSVWTCEGFRTFFTAALSWSGVEAQARYESLSDRNRFEYFGVWQREG